MANVINERYLYPNGHTTNTAGSIGTKTFVLHCTGVFDGVSGDLTKRVVLDLSTFTTTTGDAPGSVAVERIQFTVLGIASVKLEWDRTAADYVIAECGEHEKFCWEQIGGAIDPGVGTAGSGDILLTTVGAMLNGFYDITIEGRIKNP